MGKEIGVLLYSIIIALMAPFSVGCFYFGYRLGKTERMPQIKIESPKVKKERRQRTKEQEAELRRLNQIQKNLANYQGNAVGQEKIV